MATKTDLRGDHPQPITKAELELKVGEMGLQGLCETSSKLWHDHNVNRCFQTAIRTGFSNKYPEMIS